MRRTLPALLTVFLLVTAGCTTAPGAVDDTPTATPTSDPPPTETATPTEIATPTTPVNVSAVPGVAPDGSLNSTALLAAHWSAVGTAGAVTESTYTLADDRRFDRRTTVAQGFDQVHVTGSRTENGSTVTMAQWVNTTGFVALTESADRTEYRGGKERAERRYRRHVAQEGRVADFLARSSFTVQGVHTGDGTQRVTLVSTEFDSGDVYGNASVRLVVTGEGVIDTLSVNGTFRNGDEFAFRYETVTRGVETVAVPEWVRNAPPIVDARLNFEFRNCSRTYLELVHEEGDALPAGTTVEVTANGTTYETTLDRVPKNGSRYLSLTDDGLQASTEAPATAEIRDIGNEVELRVVTDGGVVLTNAGMGFSCVSAGGSGGSDGSGAASGGSSG